MKGFTLWFTGLPCSGKSTLARRIEETLLERGVNCEVLDGDEVRENLSKGLTFSKEDRDINIRRIGWVQGRHSQGGLSARPIDRNKPSRPSAGPNERPADADRAGLHRRAP